MKNKRLIVIPMVISLLTIGCKNPENLVKTEIETYADVFAKVETESKIESDVSTVMGARTGVDQEDQIESFDSDKEDQIESFNSDQEDTLGAETESQVEETVTEGLEHSGVIVLDAGHSKNVSSGTEPLGPGSAEMKAKDSSGTTGNSSGLTEYQLNLQVALQLRDELMLRGYEVVLTREDNEKEISNVERASIANELGADAFVRIHANGSEDSNAYGAMTICQTPSNPYVADEYTDSRLLSDCILNQLVFQTQTKDRGVWETDTMTGINWSEVPVTIVEMGFMTNPEEDRLMATEEYQKKLVQGIADGLDDFIAQRG